MNVKPSPRILEMLGQIEFQEWQCLAELIDNSIDELRSWLRELETAGLEPDPEDFCIEVILPTSRVDASSAVVEVRDHGRGMTKVMLNNAVRAGWSGNDRFDSLGLFGMGFNVSTARLGKITRVLSARIDDEKWTGVEIDLRSIDETFEVPEIEESKGVPHEHGTRILISQLDQVRLENLVHKQEAIRTKIGQVYSWILENSPISIRVNGTRVRPLRHCIWGPDRSITYGQGRNRQEIPAQIHIDQHLSDADVCHSCGHSQSLGLDKCRNCTSTSLSRRSRRIYGWLGIQRYLDSTKFGIDFIRNGRKILVGDKSVFTWMDINDPLAQELVEYPTETPFKGRIVGEIHLDHVPVDYKKDRFETSSREWKSAIEYLRGEGPLKPDTARRLGYAENDSPIGLLFKAFRRTDPGKRCLIPGDGHQAIHDQAQAWANRFQRGDAEFQTDEKWFEAVEYHDRKVLERSQQGASETGDSDEETVMRALGGAGTTEASDNTASETESSGGTPESGSPSGDENISVHEHARRLKERATPVPHLSRDVRVESISDHLSIQCWEVSSPPLMEWQRSRRHSPVWVYQSDGGRVTVFIDSRHEAFTVQGISILDLVLSEIAYLMLIRKNKQDEMTIPQLVHELRKLNFPEENIDLNSVQTKSRQLLERIRSAATESLRDNAERVWGLLEPGEIESVERNAALRTTVGPSTDSSDIRFLEFVPNSFLLTLLREIPEAFFDGRVFDRPYRNLVSEKARQEVLKSVETLLVDCILLASEERVSVNTVEVQRTKLGLDLLISILGGAS